MIKKPVDRDLSVLEIFLIALLNISFALKCSTSIRFVVCASMHHNVLRITFVFGLICKYCLLGSPFFQRIFSENPCKHPVIVLKDLSGWEVQAIIDFMYRGEISVGQEQLQSLIKAAESLQVRGEACL